MGVVPSRRGSERSFPRHLKNSLRLFLLWSSFRGVNCEIILRAAATLGRTALMRASISIFISCQKTYFKYTFVPVSVPSEER